MPTFFRDAMLVQLDPLTLERGSLRVANGRIRAVGENIAAKAGDEIVDCHGAVLMPGLVNGHTHLYSALAPGMPTPPRPPRNFHEILKLVWWRLDRAHTLESVEVSGRIGALAAVRCGTTTLIDHHASPNAIDGSLAALESGIGEVGCRGVLCYEVTDRNRAGEGRQGLDENERYSKICKQREDGRFAALVGAHASLTLDENTLVDCVELAKRLGLGVHIHVAEDPVDARIVNERFGRGLIEHLQHAGLLEVPGTIFAHGTHLSDSEIAIVNEHRDLSLAHNPSSNMNNGVGYTPIVRYARPPLLGTDGIGADMWREARVAEFKSHDASLPLPFGHSLKMLGASARFASRSLGVKLGVLEAGAAADLVLTSYFPSTPLSVENLAAHFLFALGPEFVRDVMIDGVWRLRGSEFIAVDEPAIRARSVDVARALHERMAGIKP